MRSGLAVFLIPACVALAGCNVDEHFEPADMASLSESRPLGELKEMAVDIRYDVGRFEISRGKPDEAFAFDLEYDRNRIHPKFDFSAGGSGRMSLDASRDGDIGLGGMNHDGELSLKLSDKIPLDVELAVGVSESNFDLSGLALRRLNLRGGVGRTEVFFDEPSREVLRVMEIKNGVGELNMRGLGHARVERLEFQGGVGKAELDFTGDRGDTVTDASVKVGIGQVRILVPRDVSVEIVGDGNFLSNVTAPGFEKDGRRYYHGSASGKTVLTIRVQTGIGGVHIELV